MIVILIFCKGICSMFVSQFLDIFISLHVQFFSVNITYFSVTLSLISNYLLVTSVYLNLKTKAIIRAAPVIKLVIFALEKVIFLNTERLIIGSVVLNCLIMKKIKQSTERIAVVKV